MVVHTRGNRALGLVVDELLDIVEERFVVQDDLASGGAVVGTAVIQNKVAQVLDLAKAVNMSAAEEGR